MTVAYSCGAADWSAGLSFSSRGREGIQSGSAGERDGVITPQTATFFSQPSLTPSRASGARNVNVQGRHGRSLCTLFSAVLQPLCCDPYLDRGNEWKLERRCKL